MSKPVFAIDVITAALAEERSPEPVEHLAAHIFRRLEAAGVVVINPQDMAWGECRDNTDEAHGPHEISTSLCVWCLEYDPE